MRAVVAVCAAVLVSVAACGGGAEPGADGSVVTAVTTVDGASTVSIDELIDALGSVFVDERQAIGAVLLAADRGYSLPQIVDATLEQRLDETGTIEDADGVVVPELTPTDVLDVEPTGLMATQAEFPSQRPPKTWPLGQVIDGLERAADEQDIGALALLLLLLEAGYDVDQLIQAVVEGGSLRGDFVLLGGDGVEIEPVRNPWGLISRRPGVSSRPDDAGAATTTTTTVATADVDDSSAALAELVRSVAGTYPIGDEVAVYLLGLPETIGARVDGEMAISADGTIEGAFGYDVTQDAVDIVIESSSRFTCPPTELAVLDDGLGFTCEMTVVVSQGDSADSTVTWSVPGIVDVELRQVVLLMSDATSGFPDVRFS